MKGYVVSVDSAIVPVVYVSLSELCREHGISYFAANRGKRLFTIDGVKVVIVVPVEIRKIAGRGGRRQRK